jgi:serine/threonine protein kinase/tetratricopeptide (TPR) repeat protein
MGVVYRAQDTSLRRTVALKFLPPQASGRSSKVSDRLRHEARTASTLNHPNICTIYEVGEDGGEVFIAMEYVEGRTLTESLQNGPLPTETVIRYGRQIASALAHAHERGIIHGDLKPQNIIVTPAGNAKILDFGLARRANPAEFDRHTLETATVDSKEGFGGTLPFMAPEQIEGGEATIRTDLWSLGIVLYEMCAGTHPFQGENLYLLCSSILRDPMRSLPANVPAGLAMVISHCLEKESSRRYQQASEARAALEAVNPSLEASSSSPTTPVPLAVSVPVATRPKRHAKTIIAFTAILLAAGLFLLLRKDAARRGGASGPVPSRVLLGVLPPVASSDASQSAFDSGLADTLSSRLGELSMRHRLSVIPMNLLVERHVNSVDAARQQFGVNMVLVLSLQRTADHVRVNYALVDPRSHQQVRSGTITAAASDPFALQDRVFEDVAAAMELQLSSQEKPGSPGTTEPAAYHFYVQARGYLQDYVMPEKVENAITLFQHALEKDPRYAAASAGLGEAYWRKYQQTHDNQWADAAIAACQKASQLGTGLSAAHSCLARAASSRGNYEQAVSEYRRAIELEPTSDDAYGGLATAYERLGRADEAERLYTQAIALRPEYWATYNWLGLFYMSHARYSEAADMFSHVVSLAPDSFTGYYNLGGVRILQGRYDQAIPLLEQSLAIRPTADARSNLGTAYFQMRRYADSAVNFEAAVKLDQKNYAMWGNLADAYYWTPGRRNEAAAAYQTAIDLGTDNLRRNPDDAELLGYLATYHAMRGEKKPALEKLAASLRLQPKSPDLLLNAGIAYQQLGETNRALSVLEKAVALGVTPEMLRDTPTFDVLRENPRFRTLIQGQKSDGGTS